MGDETPNQRQIRLGDLDASRAYDLHYVADDAVCREGVEQLDILDLAKLRVTGTLSPRGKSDWHIAGQIGATVTQSCVITLSPVKTRVDVPFERLFTAQWKNPDADSETEMPSDVTRDQLPEVLDIATLAFEEISLAMPDYPRTEGAATLQASAAPDGITPLTDDDLKPFAALKALKDRMKE
ncbi:MAG: DUF177 domain-containing protein [Pseudomonadota bacterium]